MITGRILAHNHAGSPESPLMVALHGWTDNAASLTDIQRTYADRFHVVAIDATGHGLSPRFPNYDHPMEQMVADEIATIEYLSQGEQVVLLGHSMGGAVGSAVARERPDLIKAAVFEEPAWLTEEQMNYYRSVGDEMIDHVNWCTDSPVEALTRQQHDYAKWPKEDVAGWLQGKMQVDRDFVATGWVCPEEPWESIARALAVPTLVITSDGGDVLIGPERVGDIEQLGNPYLRTVVLPGARHCVRRDIADAFYTAVDQFLAEIDL